MRERVPMSAVILAGGKSSRMGRDKALLKFGDETSVERLVSLLEPIFGEILVMVNNKTKLDGLDLKGAKIYEDLLKERGPLAAIYTGLLYSSFEAACVFACDMPLMDETTVHHLLDSWEEGLDVICFGDNFGNYQPFPGIYRRSSRYLIRLLLNKGDNSLKRLLGIAKVKPLVLQEREVSVLTNMNTIEDYRRVLNEKEQHINSL